jgi:hypothetical protein
MMHKKPFPPAYIVAGCNSGTWIDHPSHTYETVDFPMIRCSPLSYDEYMSETSVPLEINTQTLRRVTYMSPDRDPMDFFVPEDWTRENLDKRMLNYFMQKLSEEQP